MLKILTRVRAIREREAVMDLAVAERHCREQKGLLEDLTEHRAAARSHCTDDSDDSDDMAWQHSFALRNEMARRAGQLVLRERERTADQHRAHLADAVRSSRAVEALAEANRSEAEENRRRAEMQRNNDLGMRRWLGRQP